MSDHNRLVLYATSNILLYCTKLDQRQLYLKIHFGYHTFWNHDDVVLLVNLLFRHGISRVFLANMGTQCVDLD